MLCDVKVEHVVTDVLKCVTRLVCQTLIIIVAAVVKGCKSGFLS